MKYLKMLGLAAVSATALMASVGATTASATTLELNRSTQSTSVTFRFSLQSGGSVVIKNTSGVLQNTCTGSEAHGMTSSPYTANHIGGPLTEHGGPNPTAGLDFTGCTRKVTVHDPGALTIEHIAGTTNGTMYSTDLTVTTEAPLLGYILCRTHEEKAHFGTLTGVPEGAATFHVNTVLDCGALPSVRWEWTYVATTTPGLGVSA